MLRKVFEVAAVSAVVALTIALVMVLPQALASRPDAFSAPSVHAGADSSGLPAPFIPPTAKGSALCPQTDYPAYFFFNCPG